MGTVEHFPLFPLGMVALPHELVPLHIFEQRYRELMAHCLDTESWFGIVWMSDDGLRDVGCAVEIVDVLERFDDGRANIVTRGTRPFRIAERSEDLAFPSATIEWLEDQAEEPDDDAVATAQSAYADLVSQATDATPDADAVAAMSAYAMTATVEFGLDAKQGLLDLRSENARMRLAARLFRAAIKRLDYVERAQVQARSNGKVRF